MIRFGFELRPLDDVMPWGDDRPSLHWFGLTDGWYWLEVNGQQLLRRSGNDDPHPYVDYQVARFWEDVVLLTPEALEPVPADLESFIASEREQWAGDPFDYSDEDAGPDAPDHPAVTAAIWRDEHRLDLGYLLDNPHIRFWRSARDEITVDWRHDARGETRYTAGPAVRSCVPVSEFLGAVQTFDRELILAMRRRVEELERRGGLPGVHIDLAGLRKEHELRARSLAESLTRSPATDWATVREGARLLLGEPRPAGGPSPSRTAP